MNKTVYSARRLALEARFSAAAMSNNDLRALLVAANNAQMAAYRELVHRGAIETK